MMRQIEDLKERYIELRFYYYIKNIFKTFGNSITAMDIIDAYCNVGGIDNYAIRLRITEIIRGISILKPGKEESVIVPFLLGISAMEIQRHFQIARTSQYRIVQRYKRDPIRTADLKRRSDDKAFETIKQFMDIVDKVKEV